ncbi:MAG TPA: RNA pseudouridine synthase [Opitutaceae bacterium]|nr:RNA pseudouridine synthase [Opitutaceae bacterium]
MSAPPADFWEQLPLGRGVRLITRDENGVAAFAKPAGVLSHPNAPADGPRALLTCAYDRKGECFVWAGAAGGERRLWLLNRLDSATSGVILTAASEDVARAVREEFARRQVRKTYEALVFGAPRAPNEVWRDRLAVEKRGGVIRTGAAGRIPAEAHVAVLRRQAGPPPLALLQLEPKTGRSHQLRVQCARRGLPIVGDQTYGDFRRNREFARTTGSKRLFLHSRETRFSYGLAGRKFSFAAAAPLPAEFSKFL